jgi:hypothetical protein
MHFTLQEHAFCRPRALLLTSKSNALAAQEACSTEAKRCKQLGNNTLQTLPILAVFRTKSGVLRAIGLNEATLSVFSAAFRL